jgi:hypothetical protein
MLMKPPSPADRRRRRGVPVPLATLGDLAILRGMQPAGAATVELITDWRR